MCEENDYANFLYYFEMVISHLGLDARPSNFGGRHSITLRFYPCKVTARVRNKKFTLYNVLIHTLATSEHDSYFPSEETHIMIPRTCAICQAVSEISSRKN